jgi:hypothetical protein
MLKIEKITAFVATDKHGNEGIIGKKFGDMWMPFVCADLDRLHSLIPSAYSLSLRTGTPVRIVEFSMITDVSEKHFSELEKKIVRQYTVYDHPKDFPDHFVARQWQIIPGIPEPVANPKFEMLASNLDDLRDQLAAMGLTPLTRSETDDPVILEVRI